MNTPRNNLKKGFTMIETLVAIFIMTISVTGPMVFSSQALRSAYYARDQLTAFYLTQEVVELVKNIRDNNSLNPQCDAASWLICGQYVDLSQCVDADCAIGFSDPNADTLEVSSCPAEGCEHISFWQNSDGVFMYGYGDGSEWAQTAFVRTVRLHPVDASTEYEISVSIEWRSGLIDRDFSVRENITNWVPLKPLP